MEFEGLQVQVPNTTDNGDRLGPPVWEKKYYNESNDLVLGFDPFSKDAINRKAVRAKRFGIKKDEEMEVDNNPFMAIQLKNITWPPTSTTIKGELREESLLIYGVQNMSTKDVFGYFKLFGADTVEWIDDFSCNVVWEFASAAATALRATSKTYDELVAMQGIGGEPGSEDSETRKAKEVWRIGLPSEKGGQIFLRQSTQNDRKLPGAASRSYYYLKYGKDGRQSGLVSSSRKRKLNHLAKTAMAKMDPSEPDVKFMDIEVDETDPTKFRDRMDVDASPSEPAQKRNRYHQSSSLYSDRDKEVEGDVFGRLGKQSRNEGELKPVMHRDRGSIRDRLGPVKNQRSDARERLGNRGETTGDVLDLRNKLRRTQDNKKEEKLQNLSIEISDVGKVKDRVDAMRRGDRVDAYNDEESESDVSDESDSDSESDSDEKVDQSNIKREVVKDSSSEDESSSSSDSSSSSSSDSSDDDSGSAASDNEANGGQNSSSSSSSSSDSDRDTGRMK